MKVRCLRRSARCFYRRGGQSSWQACRALETIRQEGVGKRRYEGFF
jgi:hypothetical protein